MLELKLIHVGKRGFMYLYKNESDIIIFIQPYLFHFCTSYLTSTFHYLMIVFSKIHTAFFFTFAIRIWGSLSDTYNNRKQLKYDENE